MLFAYLIVSTVLGMFVSYIWSSKDFANVIIKMVFSCYTLWSAFMLLGMAWPHIIAAFPNVRMF